MRLVGSRLKFGVVLNSDEERTVRKLYRFNKSAVGRFTGEDKSVFGEDVAVVVVELIAVTVSFGDFLCTVATLHCGSLGNDARVSTETDGRCPCLG